MRYLIKLSLRKPIFVMAIGCLVAFSYEHADSGNPSEPDQLIIFVQPGASGVNTTFNNLRLPSIRKVAEEMGVAVHLVDVSNGAPTEIRITPLIVFQNYRGRSIYQGRTTTLKRIRNFIRTSRFVPQGKIPHLRTKIPIWDLGRTQVWAPLKVAPVTGTKPKAFAQDDFIKSALESITAGFKSFRIKSKVELARSDRGFYMDFYPWVSEDGTLFLSLALFSQFHCKEPVFETKDNPLLGPWKDRNKLFMHAAKTMEDAVRNRIKDPEGGDGFDVVSTDIPVVSWKDLGFPLPQPPEKKATPVPVAAKIPKNWVVSDSAQGDPPGIQFRFPAPLDNYAGEVTKARGEIYLSENPDLEGSRGFIEADSFSVTMGEPQLDNTLQGSLFLHTKKYPTATFVIHSVDSNGQTLAYGRLSPVSVIGTFTLKGKSLPLTPKLEIEPILGEDATPLLLVRGSFQIDLRNFGIEGADGPEPAKYTLKFDINFRMRPGRASKALI